MGFPAVDSVLLGYFSLLIFVELMDEIGTCWVGIEAEVEEIMLVAKSGSLGGRNVSE